MNKVTINKTLNRAEKICTEKGGRLTAKRKDILEILVASECPLSAYEVTEIFNQKNDNKMQPMSVYRMMEFLISANLVHKLKSINKFLACSHINCQHDHEIPQFLMCQKCHSVKEIGVDRKIIDEISQNIQSAGYQLLNEQIEFDCLCSDCIKDKIGH